MGRPFWGQQGQTRPFTHNASHSQMQVCRGHNCTAAEQPALPSPPPPSVSCAPPAASPVKQAHRHGVWTRSRRPRRPHPAPARSPPALTRGAGGCSMNCRQNGARLDRQAEAAAASPGPIQLRAHSRLKMGQACQQKVMLGRPRHRPATRRQAASLIHSHQFWKFAKTECSPPESSGRPSSQQSAWRRPGAPAHRKAAGKPFKQRLQRLQDTCL